MSAIRQLLIEDDASRAIRRRRYQAPPRRMSARSAISSENITRTGDKMKQADEPMTKSSYDSAYFGNQALEAGDSCVRWPSNAEMPISNRFAAYFDFIATPRASSAAGLCRSAASAWQPEILQRS